MGRYLDHCTPQAVHPHQVNILREEKPHVKKFRTTREFTDHLLQTSSDAMLKMEENITLTNVLKESYSSIDRIDSKIEALTLNLQQYQWFFSELNSLLIRSEYFEAQLDMLDAHHQLNCLRSSRGMPSLMDWKDEDLNWRTTEATLENLYLEYQYLLKQINNIPMARASHQNPSESVCAQSQNHETVSKIVHQEHDDSIKLRPIICISKSQERASKKSSEPRKVHCPKDSKSSTLLPTPENSFMAISGDETHESPKPKTAENWSDEKNFLPCTNRGHLKHTRCNSLPESVKSSTLNVLNSSNGFSDRLAYNSKMGRKFSLRHFFSHETGLKVKHIMPVQNEEGEDIKDSEILNSPVSQKSDILKVFQEEPDSSESTFDDTTAIDSSENRERPEIESTFFETGMETIYAAREEELPKFPKLQRSTSSDSIFSVISRKPHNTARNNKEQTMNWMRQFSKPYHTQSNLTQATVLSTSNSTKESHYSSRQALSQIVSKSNAHPPPTNNRFPFAFSSKKVGIPENAVKLPTGETRIKKNSLDRSISIPSPRINIPNSGRKKDQYSYESFRNPYANSQQHKQWSLLMSKFRPIDKTSAHSIVTSETGKPLHQNRSTKVTRIMSHPRTENVKGSVSVLTIGPNRSRFIQYGESFNTNENVVLSSRVSYAALKEALNNDFQYDESDSY